MPYVSVKMEKDVRQRNAIATRPRTPEGCPLHDDFTMYNIEPNLDSDKESPPGSQLEPRHKAEQRRNVTPDETFRKEISAMKHHAENSSKLSHC